MSRILQNCVVLSVLASLFTGMASADLVAHWKFDEGTGATVFDSSGNGNDGAFEGDLQWVPGQLGGALEGNGSSDIIRVLHSASLDITDAVTVSLWLFGGTPPDQPISKGEWNASYGIRLDDQGGRLREVNWRGRGPAAPAPGNSLNSVTALPEDEWVHVAVTFDVAASGNNQKIFINGIVDAENRSTTPLSSNTADVRLFAEGYANTNRFVFGGMLDDVRIYNTALAESEIPAIMKGRSEALAFAPNPDDGVSDVPRDSLLSWKPGKFAAQHNVYFGESFEDVNNATGPTDAGLTATSYEAGRFDFGQTYFWRVDEVNATPDKTVFKGEVWSFTAEPYSIQIPGDTIAVTASSASNEFSQPDKTLDGSGLGADGSHAITPESMWFTAAVDLDPWIRYDFDAVKKLDIMKVWNSNSSAEIAIGWGVKDVQIEYSVDGVNWDMLEGATQLSRAPGSPSYAQPDEIDFGGVAAQHVRLNIQSNWGGILMSYGLSEVQFYMIPAEARAPVPASGSVDVLPSTVVQWRAGREAAQHTIYMGTDADAVADGSAPSVTTSTNSLDLATLDLELGATYTWRVDEVNEAEAVSVWAGPAWSFSTVAALTVDDFESYNNISPDRPFQTWLDGFGYSADEFFTTAYEGNGSGSGTGHDIWSLSSPQYDGDIMEGTIVASGSSQSMPIYYNNASGSSHVDRTFAPAQDWTTNGVQTLGLSFFGDPDNGGQLYITINGTKVLYDLDADALKQAEWHFWAIELASVGVNLQAVTSMGIGIDGSGSGVVYVDDIALYSNAIETIEPVEPGTENLVAQYTFEGNYGDSSGNGNTLTEVGGVAIVNDSERGNVAVFNGLDAALAVPVIGDGTTAEITLATWFRLDIEHTGALWSIFHNDGWSAGDVHAHISNNAQFSMGVNGAGSDLRSVNSANVGQWYHLAYVAGPDAISLYVNGVLSQTSAGNPAAAFSLGEGTLGAWSNGAMERFIGGSVDDVRIYAEALSAEEIAGLAGRSTMYKPF